MELEDISFINLNSNSNVPTAQSDDRLARETRVTAILIFYLCTSCMYVCAYVRMFACMNVCLHVCMYVCIYVCTYVFMYVLMYVNVCMHARCK